MISTTLSPPILLFSALMMGYKNSIGVQVSLNWRKDYFIDQIWIKKHPVNFSLTAELTNFLKDEDIDNQTTNSSTKSGQNNNH